MPVEQAAHGEIMELVVAAVGEPQTLLELLGQPMLLDVVTTVEEAGVVLHLARVVLEDYQVVAEGAVEVPVQVARHLVVTVVQAVLES